MMKILCDFDGVLTEISEEARRTSEIFTQTLSQINGLGPGRLEAMLAKGKKHLHKNIRQYGWPSHGRVAAYADEDPFLENMGLSHCLDDLSRTEGGDFLKLRQGLNAQGIASFNQVSMDAFQTMSAETLKGARSPVDPAAVRFLNQAIQRGCQVTVVSNSFPTRIMTLLSQQGLKPEDREKNPECPLGVRGGAAKFELGETRRGFFAGPYWIDTARPKYEKILWEEKPDMVIGDVFSLDLGLPLFLAEQEPDRFGKVKLFLREHPYTPDWAKAFVAKGSGKQNLKIIRDLKIL